VRPEDELLLLAIGAPARLEAAANRARSLAERVRWDVLEAACVRQRLLPLVAKRLAPYVDAPAPFEERARLSASTERNANRAGKLVMTRVFAELERDGVRAMPLKGPVLAQNLYGDGGLRSFGDLDLLVTARDLAPATAAVRRLGYRDDGRTHMVGGLPLLHVRHVHPDRLPDVEVHWRIHWYEERFAAAMLQAARADADGWLRPRPAEELASLLLFYARDGLAGLRLLADIVQWWERRSSGLACGDLDRLARSYPPLEKSLATAAAATCRLGGVPLGATLPCGGGCRRALRVADWPLTSSDSQLRADALLVDLLLAPPTGRCAALRRSIVLPLAVVRTWNPGGSHAPVARVVARAAEHAARVVRRWAISLWRTRRGKWRHPLPNEPGSR
jgi:hypothetical protein